MEKMKSQGLISEEVYAKFREEYKGKNQAAERKNETQLGYFS